MTEKNAYGKEEPGTAFSEKALERAAEELRRRGWGVIPPAQFRPDLERDEAFSRAWEQVEPYTMTSPERGRALWEAVRYVQERGIPGAWVECGVWRGGSSLLAALACRHWTEKAPPSEGGSGPCRDFFLYDTFTGMTEPGAEDRIAWTGEAVRDRWERTPGWWAADQGSVARLMEEAGQIPPENLRIVPGDVLKTLEEEENLPEKIAVLRLDTDWYASTKRELEILYPRLIPGGILIIDDYGHFEGARQAVDGYFDPARPAAPPRPALFRADYTGRTAVKA